jgi:hypothetical protein
MNRILRGIDDIPEVNAIVPQYSNTDDPTNEIVTEIFADIQQHAPAHHVALAQADSVCAVCDRAGLNATNCRTKALLFKYGRLNPAAIDAFRQLGLDKKPRQRDGRPCNEARDRRQQRAIANHVSCVAEDEISVDIMCRRFCCNFLRKSRL